MKMHVLAGRQFHLLVIKSDDNEGIEDDSRRSSSSESSGYASSHESDEGIEDKAIVNWARFYEKYGVEEAEKHGYTEAHYKEYLIHKKRAMLKKAEEKANATEEHQKNQTGSIVVEKQRITKNPLLELLHGDKKGKTEAETPKTIRVTITGLPNDSEEED